MRLTARPDDRARYRRLLTDGNGRDVLLALLRERVLTSADLRDRLGCSLQTVREHLGRAEVCGLTLRQHRRYGAVHYTLTEQGVEFASALAADTVIVPPGEVRMPDLANYVGAGKTVLVLPGRHEEETPHT
jgi:DNA-binding MarR family transcriptional regulator